MCPLDSLSEAGAVEPVRRLQKTRARPRAATCVLSGVIPDPLLSTRARGWNGVTVELQSFGDLDAVVQTADHVIAVHLAGNVNVHRTRDGRTQSRTLSVGDVTITPSGPPTRWRQTGHSAVILLRLAPSYVRTVAGDECALDPDRFEIQGRFTTRDTRIEDIAHRLLAGLELEGADSGLYVDALACELAIHLVREHTTACAGTVWSMARLSPYVAGKTGTSDDENDAWFIGFTNEVTIGVWVGYDNADGRRRTLGPGMTGGKVALPIFEPIVEAVWRDYARRTVLSPPSSLAARQMAAVPIDLGSGEPLQPGTPGAFTEYLRLDAARQLVDSRYSIVSRNEAFWARSYDPGSDGDLYGPYASRTGGGYYYGDNAPPIYGPQSPYPSQGGGSMFSNRGPFGGIFGDQRYFEQREYNRQQQRRVDPDYFINRFQTN